MPFHKDVHETIMAEGWGGLEITPGDPAYYSLEELCDRACDQRGAIEAAGFDCDCTPIDSLMAAQGLGFGVAWAMENEDAEFDT